MRIGIDYRPALYGRGGIAVYARELAAALAAACPGDEIELYGRQLRRRQRTPYGGAVPTAENVRLRDGPFPSRALPWLARAGFGLDRLLGGLDVLHLTDYAVLPAGRAALVVTIHDVLFDTLPECYTADMRSGLRRTTERMVALADGIVVPSARTQTDLVHHYGADPERIHVVPHGHRSLPSGGGPVPQGPYVLAVGTLEPRKNLGRLVEAFSQVRRAHPALRLVIAGARGWLDDELIDAIRSRSDVEHVGAVGPERLGALYAGATAVAYPSLGEGFGLPVLEAMARGLPLVVGTDTTCADIAGAAALAVEPRDVEALAAAVVRVVEDDELRRAQSAHGRQVAAAHTWERAARATRAAYDAAAMAQVLA